MLAKQQMVVICNRVHLAAQLQPLGEGLLGNERLKGQLKESRLQREDEEKSKVIVLHSLHGGQLWSICSQIVATHLEIMELQDHFKSEM